MFGTYGGNVYAEGAMEAKEPCRPDPKMVFERLQREQKNLQKYLSNMTEAALTEARFDAGLKHPEVSSMEPVFALVGGAFLRLHQVERDMNEQFKLMKEQPDKD